MKKIVLVMSWRFPMAHSKRGKLTYFSDIDELKEDFLDHIEVIGNIHDKNKQKKP